MVLKLSGNNAIYRHLRKLYVMRDKMLHYHTLTILNGEEGVVVPVDKAQEQL